MIPWNHAMNPRSRDIEKSLFSCLFPSGWTHPSALTAAWPCHFRDPHKLPSPIAAPFTDLPLSCSSLTWAAPIFLFLTPLSAAGQLCWNPKDPSTKIRNKSTWPSRQIILFLFSLEFSLEGGSDFVGFVWFCVFWVLLLTWNKGLRSRLARSPRHPDRQLILGKCQVQTWEKASMASPWAHCT